MNILFCVEFYFPSVGGAQEVVRQIAERLAARGHQVTVATTKIATRQSSHHRGVDITEFEVQGNLVRGMTGEIDRYRSLLTNSGFEIVFFYAAQQWTFDAAWPVIDAMQARKVLVPCGYSGLLRPAYQDYFKALPEVLKRMDTIIYHADSYRDANLARELGLTNSVFIPNAADGEEFEINRDISFRARIGAKEKDFVVLTVGTITGMKGHLELAQAFAQIALQDPQRRAILLLNGNHPENLGSRSGVIRNLFGLIKEYGPVYSIKHLLKKMLRRCGLRVGSAASVNDWAERANKLTDGKNQVFVVDLPRTELIQAYLNADLFVFASNVEYSPLVLFEACAAGLPFLTAPVGNAAEIVNWTGGGELCPANLDEMGYTRVDPDVLATHIEALAENPMRLQQLGRQGLEASRNRYNWATIAGEYEKALLRLMPEKEDRHCLLAKAIE